LYEEPPSFEHMDVAHVELAYKQRHTVILETYIKQRIPDAIMAAMHELYIAITGDVGKFDKDGW
jgi:hypothetical protein